MQGLKIGENNLPYLKKNGVGGDFWSKSKPTDASYLTLIIYFLDDLDFYGYNEGTRTDEKSIYVVDSGLSFNIPFPILLRYYLI